MFNPETINQIQQQIIEARASVTAETKRSIGIVTKNAKTFEISQTIPTEAFCGPWREMHPEESIFVDPNHISNIGEVPLVPIRIYKNTPPNTIMEFFGK